MEEQTSLVWNKLFIHKRTLTDKRPKVVVGPYPEHLSAEVAVQMPCLVIQSMIFKLNGYVKISCRQASTCKARTTIHFTGRDSKSFSFSCKRQGRTTFDLISGRLSSIHHKCYCFPLVQPCDTRTYELGTFCHKYLWHGVETSLSCIFNLFPHS
jgi:hypothetical protein